MTTCFVLPVVYTVRDDDASSTAGTDYGEANEEEIAAAEAAVDWEGKMLPMMEQVRPSMWFL